MLAFFHHPLKFTFASILAFLHIFLPVLNHHTHVTDALLKNTQHVFLAKEDLSIPPYDLSTPLNRWRYFGQKNDFKEFSRLGEVWVFPGKYPSYVPWDIQLSYFTRSGITPSQQPHLVVSADQGQTWKPMRVEMIATTDVNLVSAAFEEVNSTNDLHFGVILSDDVQMLELLSLEPVVPVGLDKKAPPSAGSVVRTDTPTDAPPTPLEEIASLLRLYKEDPLAFEQVRLSYLDYLKDMEDAFTLPMDTDALAGMVEMPGTSAGELTADELAHILEEVYHLWSNTDTMRDAEGLSIVDNHRHLTGQTIEPLVEDAFSDESENVSQVSLTEMLESLEADWQAVKDTWGFQIQNSASSYTLPMDTDAFEGMAELPTAILDDFFDTLWAGILSHPDVFHCADAKGANIPFQNSMYLSFQQDKVFNCMEAYEVNFQLMNLLHLVEQDSIAVTNITTITDKKYFNFRGKKAATKKRVLREIVEMLEKYIQSRNLDLSVKELCPSVAQIGPDNYELQLYDIRPVLGEPRCDICLQGYYHYYYGLQRKGTPEVALKTAGSMMLFGFHLMPNMQVDQRLKAFTESCAPPEDKKITLFDIPTFNMSHHQAIDFIAQNKKAETSQHISSTQVSCAKAYELINQQSTFWHQVVAAIDTRYVKYYSHYKQYSFRHISEHAETHMNHHSWLFSFASPILRSNGYLEKNVQNFKNNCVNEKQSYAIKNSNFTDQFMINADTEAFAFSEDAKTRFRNIKNSTNEVSKKVIVPDLPKTGEE